MRQAVATIALTLACCPALSATPPELQAVIFYCASQDAGWSSEASLREASKYLKPLRITAANEKAVAKRVADYMRQVCPEYFTGP